MKVIIAGSRTIHNYSCLLRAVLESGFDITEIVSGTASGVDRMGEMFAYEMGLPIKRFPAKWRDDVSGIDYEAGKKRNTRMADYAEALIAIWDGKSSGTKDMIEKAENKNLPVFVLEVLDSIC